MNKLFSLIKLQLNAHYGLSYARYAIKNDKKALWKGIGLGLLILLLSFEMLGLYSVMLYMIYKAALSINAPEIILTLAVVPAGLIIMLFGVFYIISTLFLAKDTEFLTSLPVKPGSVFLSKFILVLIGELPFSFALMMPAVIIYGVGLKKGILYYLASILCTALIPLVPLAIAVVLTLLLMNIVAKSKRRDLITIIGGIVLIIAIFIAQNYFASVMPENTSEISMVLFQNSKAVVEFIGRVFPPSVWVTKVLTGTLPEAALNLLYLLLVSAAAFVFVYVLASFIYQKGAIAQLEARKKTGKTRMRYGRSSHVMAIFKNEWRIILRTPVYALNSLTVIIMVPMLMLLPMFGGNLAKEKEIQYFFSLIQGQTSPSHLVLILAGILSLLALMNPAISTTFSREGKNFWILKNIPARPEIQVLGKLLAGYSISFIAMLLAAIICIFAFKLKPVLVIMMIILSSLALIPVSVANIVVDLIRPKLVWSNPQEAIKQNMNSFIGMLLAFLVISVFGVIGYYLMKINLSDYALLGIMALILLVSSIGSVFLLYRVSKNAYQKIEV